MAEEISDYDETVEAGKAKTAPAKRRPAPPVARPSGQLPSWLTLAALGIALLAVVLAVFGWFKPADHQLTTGHNKQQAKEAVCGSTSRVREAVELATNSRAVDPAADVAVAVNARLALYGGGSFLHDRLQAEPNTPKDVRQAVGDYADTLQQLGINYLAGADAEGPVQKPLREQLLSQRDRLNEVCK